MPGILKLIRFRTIAFAAFTMYAMRYFVIRPILHINGFQLQMSDFGFTLLVIAICCLIAGAYVINDYFDTKADRISGVRDIVVGKHISRRTAISLHTILNIISIGIAFYLSFAVGVWKIGILFVLVSGILWFYSSCYKRFFLAGNIIVGLLAALIPVSVVIFEIPLLNMFYADLLIATDTNFTYLFNWILGFSYFIFWNTLVYEINKDIYSADGDAENGIRTIPVSLGVQAAKYIIVSLVLLCVATLLILYFTVFSESPVILGYMVVGLILPYLLYIFWVMFKAPKRSLQLGMIRLIMVLSVSFSFLLNYFFQLIFVE